MGRWFLIPWCCGQRAACLCLSFQSGLALESSFTAILSCLAGSLLRLLQLLKLARKQLLCRRRSSQEAAGLLLCLLVGSTGGLHTLHKTARFVQLALESIMLLEKETTRFLTLLQSQLQTCYLLVPLGKLSFREDEFAWYTSVSW